MADGEGGPPEAGVDGDAEPGDAERLRRALAELAEPVVADHQAELVDVEVSGRGSYSVRLLVHRSKGATVDLCEAISRELSDLLDVEDPVPGRYRLEVTSPGLDRPLRTDADFCRAQSRRLKVVTSGGRTEIGRLVAFSDTEIELDREPGRKERTADRLVLKRQEIARATIEVEF